MAINIKDKVKKQLVGIYQTIKNSPDEFGDQNVHVHLGSILTKFFGGINDDPVGQRAPRTNGKYQTFKPAENDFKKKSLNLAPVVDETERELTLSELKVQAKNLGLKYSNKTAMELKRDIAWHSQGVNTKPLADEEE